MDKVLLGGVGGHPRKYSGEPSNERSNNVSADVQPSNRGLFISGRGLPLGRGGGHSLARNTGLACTGAACALLACVAAWLGLGRRRYLSASILLLCAVIIPYLLWGVR
jgi:hypothetical protein